MRARRSITRNRAGSNNDPQASGRGGTPPLPSPYGLFHSDHNRSRVDRGASGRRDKMADDAKGKGPLSEEALQEMVASNDGGARNPTGAVALLIAVVAVVWSLFQVLLASPLANYVLPGDLINNSRQIHLAFAIFLAFMAYPMFRTSPRSYVPVYDWILALAGTYLALYGYFFYDKIVNNGGLADHTDKWAALAGLIILFEGARRALGPAMAIVATVFLSYVFFGSAPWVPEVIQWNGASLQKAMSHMWITSEGVFGIALGVSTRFVFLFVLFGALLDKAGAGNYFIKMAFGALGHLKGGPAKAAVVGSAATGLISGSSIANVVTTGTFTIPLMKRVGFTSEKGGAVEVTTHAFLPAAISYIALVYIVHLEAVKNNMPTLGDRVVSLGRTIGGMFVFFAGFAGLCYGVQYPVGWIVSMFPEGSGIVLSALLVVAYIALLWLAAGVPDLEPDDPNAEDVRLPVVGEIYKAGLYFLLPIVVLVYFLMIEQKSPGLSAFWATALLFVILVTQRPLKAMFRGRSDTVNAMRAGLLDLLDGLIAGARNMIGIGVATATAGIIVGSVSQTGVGSALAEVVEVLSGGNMVAILLLTAVLSLILGMGLPTTANYIVVSALLAPVIVSLGAQNGLLVPLIAVHLFVFYFGILADDTPPVGLAAYAAAAISGADPIRTGVQGFTYDIRTAILPFMFIFNNQLLLIGLTGWFDLVVTIFSAVTAMLVFSAATQGFWFTKSYKWESLLLLLITFTMFRPGFWWDMVYPPTADRPGAEIMEYVEDVPANKPIVLKASGMTIDGDEVTTYVRLEIPAGETHEQRLMDAGLELSPDGEKMAVDFVGFGRPAEDAGIQFGWTIDAVQVDLERPPKELMFIPALALLGLLAFGQLRRRAREEATGQPA